DVDEAAQTGYPLVFEPGPQLPELGLVGGVHRLRRRHAQHALRLRSGSVDCTTRRLLTGEADDFALDEIGADHSLGETRCERLIDQASGIGEIPPAAAHESVE